MTKFFGSWWAVVVHTIVVIAWFIFQFNLQIFMLWISLEAIFIWTVYLAASHHREQKHDRLEALQQIRIKEKMIDTLANGEKQNDKLDQITKMLYSLEEEIELLKKKK
jgi:uncharacterized membrane protein